MVCHNTAVSFLCLLVLHGFFHLEASSGARVGPREPKRSATEFIRSSCSATRYPSLCFSSLSAYASTIQTSPTHLAEAALIVSLAGASNASSAVAEASRGRPVAPRVAAAVADCSKTLRDSVGQLKESLAALGRIGSAGAGKSRPYQINNVQTWVSAALTDEDTCLEGFAGAATNGEVKDTVRIHVVRATQLTSNALALVSSSLSPP